MSAQPDLGAGEAETGTFRRQRSELSSARVNPGGALAWVLAARREEAAVSYAILQAPSTLGLGRPGVDRLPSALLSTGLAGRLSAHDHGEVVPPAHLRRRDAGTGLLDPDLLETYSIELAGSLGPLLDSTETPLVLGGDCSILLGSALALRRRGRSGLLFLDGHTDFYSPATAPDGEAASMDLALVTGRGPDIVTDLGGLGPLLRDEDVVAFGFRDTFADPDYAAPPLPANMPAFDLEHIRRLGIAAATDAALDHLTRPDGPAGFWLHLDVDVLDDDVMPAVDYRMPGGLTRDELAHVLAAAVASGRLTGVEVTILNPDLDPTGRVTNDLSDTLVAGLGPAH